VDDVTADVGKGVAAKLPPKTRVTFTDDHSENMDIAWDSPNPVFEQAGDYTVKGTVTVDGKKHPVTGLISVIDKVNLFKNGNFEQAQTLDGWKIIGDRVLDVVTKGGDALDTSAMHYWSDKAFKFTASQEFTGLADGKYTVAVSTQGGGGQSKYQLTATTSAGTQSVDIKDTKWNEWHTFTIKDVEVKDGKCTVAVTMEAAPGTWGSLDNFEFYKQK
jgi:arabinogalactan endo-1,4-beta-galactosidase